MVLRYISLGWALRLNKGTGTDLGSCLPDDLDLSTCMSWKGRWGEKGGREGEEKRETWVGRRTSSRRPGVAGTYTEKMPVSP